jgi:hypothetical protein
MRALSIDLRELKSNLAAAAMFCTVIIVSLPNVAAQTCAELQQEYQARVQALIAGTGHSFDPANANRISQLQAILPSCRDAQPTYHEPEPEIPPGSTKCGSGFCQPGTKCFRNNTCIASDAVECGNFFCPAGDRCSRSGCLPQGAVACGSGYCTVGLSCVNNQCVSKQQSGIRSWLAKFLFGVGTSQSSQALAISGNQTLTSLVQQRNVQMTPTPYGVEKMLNDPYSSKPVSASQLPVTSGDPFHPAGSAAQAQQPATSPTTPAVGPAQSSPAGTSTNNCGPGMRMMTRGTFTYCELWSPGPQ